jgi:multidrug transporter EmrE-like cation transporter
MTSRGLVLLISSAHCSVGANPLLRGGILRAGGLTLSLDRVKDQVLGPCRQPMFVPGALLYGVAAIIWFRVLSTEDLSLSYPLFVSLSFVLVTLGGAYFFRKQVSWQKAPGISVILAGFVLTVRA